MVMLFQVFVDLKHRGLMDNTVVVVTTDNGGGPWDSNTPLRGTKVGDAEDDLGHRVITIVSNY